MSTAALGSALRAAFDRAHVATADGIRRSTTTIAPSLWSWSGPHGGLIAAIALDAAAELVHADRVPHVLSAQFLAGAGDRLLELSAQVLRAGGSSDVVRVDVSAGGEPVLSTTATFARPRPGGTSYDVVPAPAAPQPDDCPLVAPVDLVPFTQHLQIRRVGQGPVEGGDTAALVAWVRWADVDQPVDAATLVVMSDALAPALYGIATVPVPVPTVDLTVTLLPERYVRDWMLVRIATRTAEDGWCVDDSDVWAPDGRHLAQARQTRRVLGDVRPAGTSPS
ncbi:MAG TPA: thioesterase family protein [Mycobacteriales bacterium]|nr:thioesterase family protein [Mycobacteriales bacterium]